MTEQLHPDSYQDQIPNPLQAQVYHNYKVMATKFLQKNVSKDCIKSGQLLYHKRTSS